VGKSTQAEIQLRVASIAQWLTEGLKSYQIYAKTKEWGITKRQTETYASRARDLLREQIAGTFENLVAESVAWYDGVIHNDSVPIRERIYARERKDKLLGLEKHYNPQQLQREGDSALDALSNLVARKLAMAELHPQLLVDKPIDVESSP